MTDFDNIHRHTRKRHIALSLLLALFIDLIPIPEPINSWLPECTALLMLYWALYRPQNIGIGVAFFLGILMDIGLGTPLGEHALAYTIAVYVILQNQRQVSLYPFGLQSLAILGTLLLIQCILIVVTFFQSHQFAGWSLLVAPFTSALLWPLLNKLMLYLSQSHRL
ncbi:rod shape-determining protein MreD [Snodgrassella sp. CFCC 13594]|uniref:rod shape-determining protein MreD n=1 Tax=Snodgrassella sp. CFCC 13594 TaxID=1775559 RepID=UPI00082EE153|nr:rod shape-determining protein MreD [Snodgrassella sp. CFCC 13594]